LEIRILEFREGAENAKGLTVIIDVFRAFSVACYASDAGADRIIAVPEPQNALILKDKYKETVLAGERDEKKIKGFDLGNSPTEIIKTNLTGKTLIMTTTAGTAGLLKATGADQVITGSLVNASAVIDYIRSVGPGLVSLVAMGYRGSQSAEEDLLCAEIISDGLRGIIKDYNAKISSLRHSAGKRFFESSNLEFSPPTDFFLCTMMDRFDFILKAERRPDANIDLLRIDLQDFECFAKSLS
jgi:2-phosphosulfolactate phosphatase